MVGMGRRDSRERGGGLVGRWGLKEGMGGESMLKGKGEGG